MKQITIYEFLKKNKDVIKDGYVAMNKDENWVWFKDCPKKGFYWYGRFVLTPTTSLCCFNIAPFDGDWKDSLIKVEHKEEK